MTTDLPDVSVTCSWYDLPCNVSAGLTWFHGALVAIPKVIYADFMSALSGLLAAIPVPDFVTSAASNIAGLSAATGIGYLMDVFAVPTGAGIIFSALIARFLLRRIPFIG